MNKTTFLKRTTAAVLLVMLIFAAGCAQPASDTEATSASADVSQTAAPAADSQNLDPDNPVTLTLWHYYSGENQQELEEAVSEFNQGVGKEHGVQVEAVAMGSIGDMEDAVTDSAKGVINSAEMPDIFSCYADKALELDELGVLCDLSEYITPEEQDEYVSGFIADGVFDGRLMVLPIVKSTELLYVNETALDEFSSANPGAYTDESLATWEALYDLSKAYYEWTDAQTPDAHWDGKGFMGVDELANYLIISDKQLGVDLLDGDDASVNLDAATLRKIFDIYYQGMVLGYFDEEGQFCSDDMKTGLIAAYVGSSSSASYFPTFTAVDNQEVDIELLAAGYPVFEGGEPYAIQQGAGMAVAKTDAAREEGACLFLKWFTDIEQNVQFAMRTGYLPVKTAAYESEEFRAALEELAEGDAASKNVAEVYAIALEEITEGNAYAATPFAGSYGARSVLKSTLSELAAAGKDTAETLKNQGMSAEEILTELEVDAVFEEWLTEIRSELDAMGVQYNNN